MAAPKARPAGKAAAPQAPPYYIATAPLFIDGNQFARAHNPGDHVPVEHVATYGWADQVRLPDGYEPADQSHNDEPETPDGQATSSEGSA